jgi:hypothetical protein
MFPDDNLAQMLSIEASQEYRNPWGRRNRKQIIE